MTIHFKVSWTTPDANKREDAMNRARDRARSCSGPDRALLRSRFDAMAAAARAEAEHDPDLDAVFTHYGVMLTEPVFVPAHPEAVVVGEMHWVHGGGQAHRTRAIPSQWRCLVLTNAGISEMDPTTLTVLGVWDYKMPIEAP